MVENIVSNNGQIFWIAFSAVLLVLFAVFLALRNRPGQRAGTKGHRAPGEHLTEHLLPDGYIDSFAGEIEEAGGGLPPLVRVVLIGVLAWWVIYLILYWNP